jgi:hypothetical protein
MLTEANILKQNNMNNEQKYLVSLFETLPKDGYSHEWVKHSELLRHLTSTGIKKYCKLGYIESNHGDYDWGEPAFRLTVKTE